MNAAERGVRIGMTVKEAAHLLLVGERRATSL